MVCPVLAQGWETFLDDIYQLDMSRWVPGSASALLCVFLVG